MSMKREALKCSKLVIFLAVASAYISIYQNDHLTFIDIIPCGIFGAIALVIVIVANKLEGDNEKEKT